MDKKQFTEELMNQLNERIAERNLQKELLFTKVQKINRTSDAIIIEDKERPTTSAYPTWYVDNMYDIFRSGKSIEFITDYMLDSDISLPTESITNLSDYGRVKDFLVPVLVDTDLNKQYLERHPHRQFLNLSVLYKAHIPTNDNKNEDGRYYTIISNDLAKALNVTEEILYEDAVYNLQNTEFVFNNMSQIIKLYYGIDLPEDNMVPMWVLSFSNLRDGSSLLLSDNALKEAYNKIGCKFIIIPSSSDELLLIRKDSDVDILRLLDLVGEMNKTLPREILLTQALYTYDGSKVSLLAVEE